jgi:hypothetical protein
MKKIKTDICGFGVAYDTKAKELLIHFLFWCFEIKIKM